MWRRWSILLLFIVLVHVQNLSGSASAAAPDVSCPNVEEQIYEGGNAGARGTYNEFRSVDRDLNQSCTGFTTVAWSTANVVFSSDTTSWVEIGYEEFWGCCGLHGFVLFTEWGIGGTTKAFKEYGQYSCILDHSADRGWRVTHVADSTSWKLRFYCLDGSGVNLVATYDTGIYRQGIATGETGRRGGVETGMGEHQSNLQYSDGSKWIGWLQPYCLKDSASNWDPKVTGTDEYITYKPPTDTSC
jgi:hypothetical protein